ncbi:MAG: hypothetical protein WC758_04775 [Candidatus Woesearchaeota archaeon]|jgi:hypothetical protein
MGNITLSIPKDVHEEMRQFSDIKWSEVARLAIVERIQTLKLAESIAKKSKLTKKDAENFSKMINRAATQRFLDENNLRLEHNILVTNKELNNEKINPKK